MSLAKIGLLTLIKIVNPSICKATLALTWRCNHRCQTCNIWHDSDYSNELTTDEFEKIINRNKLLWVALTGGEAFLRKDIAEIMRMAMKKYPSVSITTNGSQPEKIEKSVRYALQGTKGILAVNLSLDGNEEQHDRFTGVKGSFQRVTETVDRLIALKNNHLKLTIENLVSLKTHDGIEFVRDYAKSKGVSLAYTIEMRSDFYKNTDMPYEGNSLPDTRFELGNPFNYLYIRQAKRNKPVKCVAGQYDCAITPDGFVKPCWFVDAQAYNIRDTEYRIVPLGCEEIVDKCNKMGRCWTPCTAYSSMIFRPWRVL